MEINFKFQYFQIKPSITTLYKRRHIPGFVATGHIYVHLNKLGSLACYLAYK